MSTWVLVLVMTVQQPTGALVGITSQKIEGFADRASCINAGGSASFAYGVQASYSCIEVPKR